MIFFESTSTADVPWLFLTEGMLTGEKVVPKVLIVSIFKDMWKQPEQSAAACENEREEELQPTGNGVVGAKCR